MRSNRNMLYTIRNIFSRVIRFCPCTLKIDLIWEIYKRPKFGNNNSANFGSFGEKWHLDVVPMERHIVYYREGSGASSQRLWAVWNLCLRLSLLSLSHHFHSMCINYLLVLIVQVDIIMNFRLWVHPSPILELQHTLLTPKCYKLRSVPQLYSSSVISLSDPPMGPMKSLGARQSRETQARSSKWGGTIRVKQARRSDEWGVTSGEERWVWNKRGGTTNGEQQVGRSNGCGTTSEEEQQMGNNKRGGAMGVEQQARKNDRWGTTSGEEWQAGSNKQGVAMDEKQQVRRNNEWGTSMSEKQQHKPK